MGLFIASAELSSIIFSTKRSDFGSHYERRRFGRSSSLLCVCYVCANRIKRALFRDSGRELCAIGRPGVFADKGYGSVNREFVGF